VGDAAGTPVPTPGLREVSVGEWEGFTRERLESEYPDLYQAWLTRPSWDLVPGGEGLAPFVDRTRATLAEILARHGAAEEAADGAIVMVTHIGVIRLLLSMAFGIAADNTRWRWAVANTSITAVEAQPEFARWEAGEVEVLAINDSSHLDLAAAR
jgi:broad specificity phosphatase PhoE